MNNDAMGSFFCIGGLEGRSSVACDGEGRSFWETGSIVFVD
jgi:hypothetical protein